MNQNQGQRTTTITIMFTLAFIIFAIVTIFITNNILDNGNNEYIRARINLYIILSFSTGLVVSIIGVTYLAREYRKDLLGFNPAEIAILYSENKSIIEQLNEGVISLDLDYHVKTINDAAKRMLLINDTNLQEVLDQLDFKSVIVNRRQISNKLVEVNKEQLLVSSFPLYSQGKVIGGTMIFRSRLEVEMLLDQLSGYRKISKALREQKHEFQNKLHVILGLIKMKDYETVNSYINQNIYHTNLTSDYYSSRIKDDQISALFVGKDIQSKEFDTTVQLSSDSYLSDTHHPVSSEDLIIVIGNLIDNALEAFKGKNIDNRKIDVKVLEEDDSIKIGVSDNAGGIDPRVKRTMFKRGVSTKKGDNRGTGLYLISEIVNLYSGQKQVQSSARKTYIEVILKKVKK